MNNMKFEEWWEQYSRNDFRRSDEIACDAWEAATRSNQLLIDAARKAVRCRRNGQWKNLEDAVMLMEVALNECDDAKASTPQVTGAPLAAHPVDCRVVRQKERRRKNE